KYILRLHFIFYSCTRHFLNNFHIQQSVMARKKFALEYIIRSSPAILWEFVTQPDSLAQWFCDHCDSQDDIFIFGWGGSFQRARQEIIIDDELVNFHWEDTKKDEHFSFRVYKSEISNDTVLE